MKPPRFTYHDPQDQSEALALLEAYEDDAKILAGGQSLVPLLNMRLAQPAHLIDINRLPGLSYICEDTREDRREEGGVLTIGALTRHRDIEHSALVSARCPLLAQAIRFVGHAPIRSRGTLGGSLVHADPSAELPTVLLALDGVVRLVSHAEQREVAASEFFVDQMQTALTSKELLVEARVPMAPLRSGAAFLEISRRHGDFALVGVAAQLSLDEQGKISSAHLALMGVAPTPVRAYEAEQVLSGELPGVALFSEAAYLASRDLDPVTDLHASSEYRRMVAGELVKRALDSAVKRAQGGEV